jgi:hypothetical protein
MSDRRSADPSVFRRRRALPQADLAAFRSEVFQFAVDTLSVAQLDGISCCVCEATARPMVPYARLLDGRLLVACDYHW